MEEDEAAVSIAATKEGSSFILTGLHFALDQEQKPANKHANKLAPVQLRPASRDSEW